MDKKEIAALTLVVLVTVGFPALVHYYEYVYRPYLLYGSLPPGSRVWNFVVDAMNWNLTEIKVSKGDLVNLSIHTYEVKGICIEGYVPKQPIGGSLTIRFIANKTGTFPIMLTKMVLECHCWVSSEYEEVGKLIVLEKENR
jgi:hypothetical protein